MTLPGLGEELEIYRNVTGIPGQATIADCIDRVEADSRPTYRERREARAERLRGWADKRVESASAVLESHERYRGDHAFNFQPGHIPARARVIAQQDRAFESLAKADGMASRAAGIESALATSIYSDDPDAIEALETRIAKLEADRDSIKAYNVSCRKGAPDLSLLSDKQRRDLASVVRHSPYSLGKGGSFPAYGLQNLSGNITRQRARVAQLKAKVQ